MHVVLENLIVIWTKAMLIVLMNWECDSCSLKKTVFEIDKDWVADDYEWLKSIAILAPPNQLFWRKVLFQFPEHRISWLIERSENPPRRFECTEL